MPKIDTTSGDYQRAVGDFVHREVGHCVSSLVDDLARAYGGTLPESLRELAEEAFELATPTQDYEEAISWEVRNNWDRAMCIEYLESLSIECRDDESLETLREAVCVNASEEGGQEFADNNRIDPYEREIYEHWIVSDWLARKLAERGERTGKLGNLTIWGRPTTGQAILLDHVICEIYNATQSAAA